MHRLISIFMVFFALSCMMLIMSSFPMIIVSSIIITTVFSSFEMMKSSNLIFMTFIILFLFIGGLMVIYIFILSMNPNEKIKNNLKLLFLIPLSFIFINILNNSQKSSNVSPNFLYQMSWNMLTIIMSVILISMMFMSKLIFNPSKPIKSIK